MEIVVVAATSAALSLAALAVSVLLRRAEEAEAGRRARVTARFDRSFRVLHLTNGGPAAARGVTVELRPVGGGQPPGLDLGDLPADPCPGQELFLDAEAPAPDGAAAMTATVRWTDDRGTQDETFLLSTRF